MFRAFLKSTPIYQYASDGINRLSVYFQTFNELSVNYRNSNYQQYFQNIFERSVLTRQPYSTGSQPKSMTKN
jgi:hypothetical protein